MEVAECFNEADLEKTRALISESKSELFDWPPENDESLRFFITYEIVKRHQAKEEPIEGAEWVVLDKYIIYPAERGDWAASGPNLLEWHGTRADAFEAALEKEESGETRNEKKFRKSQERIVLLGVFLIICANVIIVWLAN